MFKRHKREALGLRRDLGLFETTLAGVGIIVGAGIYVLIGAAAGHAGNGLWISFVIAGAAALLTGLSYAELSSIYADDSGEYAYVEHTFGKQLGFVVGYLIYMAGIIGAAAVSLGFAGYLNNLLGLDSRILTALATVIIFTLINFIGIKNSMRLNVLFTSISVIGLLLISIFAIPRLPNLTTEVSNMAGVLKASSLIFFAYIGFESVVKLAEETKDPKKNIPLALLLSLVISTLIYILVAIASLSVLDWQQLAQSPAPLADVAGALMGSHAGLLLSLIAIVSTGNTVLMLLIAMSRMLYGMSKDLKIQFCRKINSTGTPYIAAIITSAIAAIFILIGNIEVVAELTNFAVFATFGLINITLIKSRYMKHPKELFHEPSIGKFPILALLGLFTNIFMIFNLEKEIIIAGPLLVLLGLFLYRFLR